MGDRFTEKILHGPIHLQLEAALRYIREQVLLEKVIKVLGDEKAVRCYNYPYEALEEILANSVFHKSWDDRNPIEVRINHDSIEVLNFEGPMPPITNADLKKPRIVSRHYRNRRIGDFLKEMHMTEGRSTGFPKIYQAVKRNDSPMPIFETDDRNGHFLATMPIHQAFVDEKAYLASIGKELDDGGKKDDKKDDKKELSDIQLTILSLIENNDKITIPVLARKTGTSERTLSRELKIMREELKVLTRECGRKDGRWVITQS